jgi:hypothetical protein
LAFAEPPCNGNLERRVVLRGTKEAGGGEQNHSQNVINRREFLGAVPARKRESKS